MFVVYAVVVWVVIFEILCLNSPVLTRIPPKQMCFLHSLNLVCHSTVLQTKSLQNRIFGFIGPMVMNVFNDTPM